VSERFPLILPNYSDNPGVKWHTFRKRETPGAGTNHFGHFLLTDLLLPTLEATAKPEVAGVATVVAVSSAAHCE
jgi:hypothetical protein